jgi:hypothetical protein
LMNDPSLLYGRFWRQHLCPPVLAASMWIAGRNFPESPLSDFLGFGLR